MYALLYNYTENNIVKLHSLLSFKYLTNKLFKNNVNEYIKNKKLKLSINIDFHCKNFIISINDILNIIYYLRCRNNKIKFIKGLHNLLVLNLQNTRNLMSDISILKKLKQISLYDNINNYVIYGYHLLINLKYIDMMKTSYNKHYKKQIFKLNKFCKYKNINNLLSTTDTAIFFIEMKKQDTIKYIF